MRLKYYKRSAEKFVSRIDPEAFSASGSCVIFPVTCHLRFKAPCFAIATRRQVSDEARRTRRNSNEDTSLLVAYA